MVFRLINVVDAPLSRKAGCANSNRFRACLVSSPWCLRNNLTPAFPNPCRLFCCTSVILPRLYSSINSPDGFGPAQLHLSEHSILLAGIATKYDHAGTPEAFLPHLLLCLFQVGLRRNQLELVSNAKEVV
jgi:hypothetical protein